MTEALCLDRICQRLEARYGCHTILLYGSRARGEARADSDFDVAGFRDAGDAVREARDIDGFYLDAWVYPTARAERPTDLLHLRGARVLRERDGLGTRLLARLETLAKEPPPPLPAWDRDACVRFRADSYAASFGSAQAFWDENGADGARYLERLAGRMAEQPTFA
jgi:hypothetical protein